MNAQLAVALVEILSTLVDRIRESDSPEDAEKLLAELAGFKGRIAAIDASIEERIKKKFGPKV